MKYLIISLGLLIFMSCGSVRKSEPFIGALDTHDEVLLKGEASFSKHCSRCHPAGEAGLGPALNDKKLVPTFLIKFQIRNGLGAMPSFSRETIPSDELDALVKYIKVMQSR
jgi:mono/diheme cytochrome c family protein